MPAVVAGLFTVLVIAVMLWRLRYGTEFTDEAFPTALAYRFALGDRPFIDEIHYAQTAGLLLFPFVWVWLKIAGSSAGIVLYTRVLFLAFKLAVGGAVVAAVRRHLRTPLAIVVGLGAVVFVPHSIPNVGYNVLGGGLQAIAGFLAARACDDARPRRLLLASGVSNGLAAVAYPPLGVPAVLLALVLLATRYVRRSDVGTYVLGGIVGAGWLVPLLVRAGSAQLHALLDLSARTAERPPSKLLAIARELAQGPIGFWLLAGAATLLILHQQPRWSALVVPLFVACLALRLHVAIDGSLFLTTYLGLFAPTFLFLLWKDRFCRMLFLVVWLPSLVGGLLTAFMSGNGGAVNGGVGFHAGALVFGAYAAIAVTRLWDREGTGADVLRLLGPAILVLALLRQFASTMYREDAIPALTARIPDGPHRGLYTTPERAVAAADLVRVFAEHDDPGGKLAVLWELPGVHLYSRMRPATSSVWTFPVADQEAFLRHYRANVTGKGIALLLGTPAGYLLPVEPFITSQGHVLETIPLGTVWSEPTP